MEVGGILAPGTINGLGANQWHLGERLLVEVVQKTGEGEGIIRIKGQNISALLETSIEVGEKFWVKVGDVKEGSFLLIREPSVDMQGDTHVQAAPQQLLQTYKQEDIQAISQKFQQTDKQGETQAVPQQIQQTDKQGKIQVAPQQLLQLTERGLPVNQDIITLLKAFPTANPELIGAVLENIEGTMTDEFIANLKKTIPVWGGLSEENGVEKLVECLRNLGLNYEQRIQQLLKLDFSAKEVEKNSLKDTFKFKLLEAIQNQEGQDLYDADGPLAHLLQNITGQQLWLKTGALDNAYMLLHLPLLNQGQLVPAQIAIESARKGPKMDEQHCRVAIQVETQQLGDIGIDAFFDQDSVTFRVLTRNLPVLSQLLEEVMPETKAEFSKLGFNLARVETGDLDQNLEFQNFVRGIRRSGVDVRR